MWPRVLRDLHDRLESMDGFEFMIVFDIQGCETREPRCGLLVVGETRACQLQARLESAGLSEAFEANCVTMRRDEIEDRVTGGDPYLTEVLLDESRCVLPGCAGEVVEELAAVAARAITRPKGRGPAVHGPVTWDHDIARRLTVEVLT